MAPGRRSGHCRHRHGCSILREGCGGVSAHGLRNEADAGDAGGLAQHAPDSAPDRHRSYGGTARWPLTRDEEFEQRYGKFLIKHIREKRNT
ncbi:hypothetical protein KCP74_25475 (plasmid) [Salmonella enterica subsp. enterica]|nr:hypothetical protein KCP74_25475 [Salmonella enterica subsp. enterica]